MVYLFSVLVNNFHRIEYSTQSKQNFSTRWFFYFVSFWPSGDKSGLFWIPQKRNEIYLNIPFRSWVIKKTWLYLYLGVQKLTIIKKKLILYILKCHQWWLTTLCKLISLPHFVLYTNFSFPEIQRDFFLSFIQQRFKWCY